MTKQDTVILWRKEAEEAFRAAKAVHDQGTYWLALFHCHLAVEKALKALYVEERDADPPPTHELLEIADQFDRKWEEGMISLFDSLSDFAVESRYHDEEWRKNQATEKHSSYWLERTESLLSALIP